MKRQAASMDANETAVPECKRPRRATGLLPSRQQLSQRFHLAGKEHILIARLQVRNDPEHACVKRIHAIFNMRVVGQSIKSAEIGYLYGQTIDRTATDYHQPEQPLFISEMLSKRPAAGELGRPMIHSTCKEIDETETIMQHIFQRNGTPREPYSRKFLDQRAKLHFIAEFQLDPAYRGCGLARIAMHTYLCGIQRLEGCHGFRGTVLLSPAALPQRKEVYAAASPSRPIKSLVDVEHALISSYERAGFKVWSKGDDRLEGAANTIMGLRLTGPKIAKVRTEPFSLGVVNVEESVCLDSSFKRADSGI